MMIEADLDRYGSLVRSSCLADYLEVVALKGQSCTFAQLEDIVLDRWPMRGHKIVLPYEELDDIESCAEGTQQCIIERSDILGDKYPFTIEGHQISLRKEFEIYKSPYLALLGVTVVHAFELEPNLRVDQLLEALVVSALEELGLTVANVGEISRSQGRDFTRTLEQLSATVGIAMNPNAAVRRIYANDAGIDVLAHVNWNDRRSGRWSLIGQVTCGSSDTWNQKIAEPSPSTWQRFMTETAAPFVFLAVPHHVEHRAFREITERNSNTLIDRTRLASFMTKVPADAIQVLNAVLDASVQTTLV